MPHPTTRRSLAFLTLATLTQAASASLITNVDPHVSLRTVATNAFAGNDIHVVANARNTLLSHNDKYQYAAYYAVDPANATTTSPYAVYVARRDLTEPTSQFVSVKVPSANRLSAAAIADDHRAISIAIDNGGFLHVSYGMHNNDMRYFVTNRSAAAAAWPNFTSAAAYTNYTTFGGNNTNVTYPEFTRVPGPNNLLYTWRKGGSGNGDMFLTRVGYNPAASPAFQFAAPTLLVNGTATGDSAYTNNFVYAKDGHLMMSWVWRQTPGYQSNHDLMFAKSPDHGATWTDAAGNPLAAPFGVDSTPPAVHIPANSSLINTTTMAADSQSRPVIATWYAPGAAQGNHVRQYMLEYWDGAQWLHSQITDRKYEVIYGGDGTPTTSEPTNDNDVRDLGRPLVLVDAADRVIVLMRYRNDVEDPANPDPLAGNRLVAAFSTDKIHWDFVTLLDQDLGNFEPAGYDQDLWSSQNKLSLLYQPTNPDGSFSPNLQTLEWDAAAFFAAIPEPASLSPFAALPLLAARRRRT
jgi:hypothetical protein